MRKELLIALFAMVLVSGCAKKQSVNVVPEADEKMVWSSMDKRPGWTVMETEMVEGQFAFIGLSDKYATEKDGRDDALRAATGNIAKYISTVVQDKFQKIQTSYNLSSDIVDPTNVARRFEEQMSAGFVSKVKPKEWYMEKWQENKTGRSYFKVFVLARIPKESIDKAYEELMNGSIEDLKNKKTKMAQDQYQNTMKAFEDVKTQGFTVE